MNEKLLVSISTLKKLLDSDPRIINLDALSKEISSSLEVNKLSMDMQEKASVYEDALKHFKEDSPEYKNAQHALFLSKKRLDEHPLVHEYNKCYAEVQLLYNNINKELFGSFQKKCEIK